MEILSPYIEKGLVSYYNFPKKHRQKNHYRKVYDMENLKKNTKILQYQKE